MKSMRPALAIAIFTATVVSAQTFRQPAPQAPPPRPPDPRKMLVDRLDLERYKATIKALTTFGDRLAGTDRNRAAVDWTEQQLKSYGCTGTARVTFAYPPTREYSAPTTTAARGTPPAVQPARGVTPVNPMPVGRAKGNRGTYPNIANTDPNAQPDPKLRELNAQPVGNGPLDEVYCTKVGTVHPDEMYIVGGHMDGRGFGEAANDDASGTAIVMEMARIFSAPDVQTERSIRFILWNAEEGGFIGASAYIRQREALQGKEDPPGSGRYPEPKWLGMIQHDMMLFDHGMPSPDGSVSGEQRPEADVVIEFLERSTFSRQSQELAWVVKQANDAYATDYPARVGNRMAATDSNAFASVVAAISLRENESTVQINNGWDPHHHRPTDLYSAFSDKDFRLGLNAAQSTLGAVAHLAGATVKP